MEQMQKDNYFFHTEKLTVGYNGVPLIQDIEIGLKKGEILGFSGLVGAGRSELMQAIFGYLPVYEGNISSRGKKWKKFNSDKICELLYAKFQGRKELIAHFEKGKVLTFETEDKRPLILPVPHQFPKINLPFYYLDLFIKLYPCISYKIKNNNDKNNLFSKFFTINGSFHKKNRLTC